MRPGRVPGTRADVCSTTYMRLRSLLAAGLLLALPATAFAQADTPRHVHLEFVHSAYADFLYYAFTRNSRAYPALDTILPLTDVPGLRQLVTLPERALHIDDYDDILTLLEPYRAPDGMYAAGEPRLRLGFGTELPPYDTLLHVVQAARPHFDRFLEFWQREIEPAELRQIETWREQAAHCAVLDSLQAWSRLRFATDTLRVGAIALHLAASSLALPAGVHGALQRTPRLGWLIGHEATHLLVGDAIGAGWQKSTRAEEAIARWQRAGGDPGVIEETLAVHMQVVAAQACGQLDAGFRISTRIPHDDLQKRLLVRLEDSWPAFRRAQAGTLVDFLLDAVLATAQAAGESRGGS